MAEDLEKVCGKNGFQGGEETVDNLEEIKGRIVEQIREWKKSGKLVSQFYASVPAIIILLVAIRLIVKNPNKISPLMLFIVGVIAEMVFCLLIWRCQAKRAKCNEKINEDYCEYARELKGALIEDRLQKSGMKKVHFREKSGIWASELIRSGLISESEASMFQSHSYIEGIAGGQKFHMASIERGKSESEKYGHSSIAQHKGHPAFSGKLWVFTRKEEFPCKVVYMNSLLNRYMESQGNDSLWCERDLVLRKFTARNMRLNGEGMLLTDDPAKAADVLTEEMEDNILAYMDQHKGEAFFISFVGRDIFFFDYAEHYAETDTAPEFSDMKPDDMERYSARLKEYAGVCDKESERISKYLFDILGIFQGDGIMWNSNTADNDDMLQAIDRQLDELRMKRITS